MATSISRIRIKIQRAKEHIRDLEGEIRAFLDTNPYTVGTKRDPQNRKLIYYIAGVKDTPDRIAAITGEVLQDLRSALDHLAYALYMVGPGGSSGTPGTHVYFPIADDAAKHAAESPGKVKGMRQDAVDAINAVKPYKGGNDTLWILHRLNNIDKHRFVIMVGSAFQSVDLGAYVIHSFKRAFPQAVNMPIAHAFFRPRDRLFPLKAGDELFIGAPDDEVNQDMQFRFDIAFGEPRIIEGASLIETLQGMADLVDNLVTDFAPLLI